MKTFDGLPPALESGALLSRRGLLLFTATSAVLAQGFLGSAHAKDSALEELYADPTIPVGGNKDGSLTILNFFDYNCPYCRRATKPLEAAVKKDGDVRVLYKDWPILTPASVVGAQLALAAHKQGRYEAVHNALMSMSGRADEATMTKTANAAGVDAGKLAQALKSSRREIAQTLSRNSEHAEAIGLAGTPGYLVGKYRVASALDEKMFTLVINDARKKAK